MLIIFWINISSSSSSSTHTSTLRMFFFLFCRICRCICCPSSYYYQFWAPSCKFIYIFIIGWFSRIRMSRNFSVFYFCSIDQTSIFIEPSNCIFIFYMFICSPIWCISCCRYWCWSPSNKFICIFCICRLINIIMYWHFTICYNCFIYQTSILI